MSTTYDPINGNAIDNGALRTTGGFTYSQYSAVKATSTTPASETIPSGATRCSLANLDSTAANYLLIAFGVDAADAETNLATGGFPVRAGSIRDIRIPATALEGGIAWKSAAGTPPFHLGYGI